MRAIELVDRDDASAATVLYACRRCGTTYDPALHLDPQVGHDRARTAAEDCRRCTSGEETDTDETREEARRRRIAAATTVPDLGFCFSDNGTASYPSPDDARDSGETGVFGAHFVPYRLALDSMLQQMIEEHHDDASVDDLRGVEQLAVAVDAFNEEQTGGSYEMDEKIWKGLRHDQTFAMIKPDATARGIEEAMIADMQAAGFIVLDRRRRVLDRSDAEWLYREHAEKAHFNDLVDYTISGPVEMLLLQADDDNAPALFRGLMGPTDRTKAGPETLRAKYAIGLRENSIHGSDGPASAVDEIMRFMRRS